MKKYSIKIQYNTCWGQSLMLVSSRRRYPLVWEEGNFWTGEIPSADLKDYFYAVVNNGLIERMEWDNHHLVLSSGGAADADSPIIDRWIDAPEGCAFPRRHIQPKFDKPGYRGAGLVIPVFSLRSAAGFGIGEFLDLKHVIDFAFSTGMSVIQLLPVNDTTRKGDWDDSYPYSPVSSFALHPLYLNIQETGLRETAAFLKEQKQLNALDELDYPRVFKAKMSYIRKSFRKNGASDMARRPFAAFVRENAFWLDEYCSFCAKRDSLEPEYYAWIQYHLDRQLSEVVAYAKSKGVSLKGDLPIGVSGDSADAYFHPELFNLDSCAGAPPDFFSRDGQNWGFPTYNWDNMAKDHYAWWKARLRKMSCYFDAFRIDHILGFFRIWEIPAAHSSGLYGHFNPALPYTENEIRAASLPVEGLFLPDPRHPGHYQPMINPYEAETVEGSGVPSAAQSLPQWQKDSFNAMHDDFFFRRNNEYWRLNAEAKLPELLSASGMLACGEDLGMVPDCVLGVMDHWKILSLEMPNMDKGRPWPYFGVCATSSHDMETMRMQHADDIPADECERLLAGYLSSSCMLAVFPVQDWVAIDDRLRKSEWKTERINDPSNPHHHWRWRFHLDVQVLSEGEQAASFRKKVFKLVSESGRN